MQKPMNFGGWGGGPPQQMPQGQQGGMPQPPMGGGAPPMRGGQQVGQGGVGGSPQQQPSGGMPQFGMVGMRNAPGGGAAGYQSQVDALQRQLMMAQINGAPPQVIANLQMDLQQAQRGMQQAGMQEMYGHQMNRPQMGPGSVGTNGRGGSPPPQYGQQMNDWNATMQLLMGLYGMGGGGRGIGG